MILINTRSSLVVLPPLARGEGQRLSPGENDVDDTAWAAWTAPLPDGNKSVQKMVEHGVLEVGGKGKATPILETIHTMSVADAKKRVADEGNTDRLATWLKDSKRPQLKSAIQRRQTELAAITAKEEDSDPVFGES